MSTWIAILGCMGVAGCMTVGAGGRVDGHYFGYVRVRAPLSPRADLRLEDITALGGWIEPGAGGRGLNAAGVGFRRLERATTAPDRCGLTIIVTNEAQLEPAEALVKTYAEGQGCVTRPFGE